MAEARRDDARPKGPPPGPVGRMLYHLSRLVAVSGGLVLVALTVLTVYSILGRQVAGIDWLNAIPPFAWMGPVTGDFELVELGCGVAIFSFLPYCQLARGNVAVDFFTLRAGARTKAALTLCGDLAYAAIAMLLAWRLALGGADLRAFGETTMVLRVPVWWGYVPAFGGLVLLSAVCLYTSWHGLKDVLGRGAPTA